MLPPSTMERIAYALHGLQYGSIQLVVHDGYLVRIERFERTRLTVSSEASPSPTGPPTETAEVRHQEA